ncbi:MAG: peptidase domain-containing ABC transporter [Bacteroidaceae bacterium]|nr:peptidase domain-containing ABC transporter [Bacteroidaceae bacterium]
MLMFPFVPQHDSMQCGIACLNMVCRYYGRRYSMSTLSRYCHATKEGVSLLGISQAAESLGMETMGLKVTLSELSKLQPPCILHWNQNHFVVFYGKSSRGRFRIADPGKGKLTYNEEEMIHYWLGGLASATGIAMILKPTKYFYEHRDRETMESHSFLFLFDRFLHYKKEFAYILFCSSVASGLQLVLPFLTQAIVDKGITHHNLSIIYIILLGQLCLTIGKTAADFTRNHVVLHVGLKIDITLVSDFFIKLLLLPMYFFDVKLLGDLQQRIRDHDRVKSFLTNQLLSAVFSSISFIVFGVVLLKYSQIIFAVFLTGTLLYGIWLMLLLKKRRTLDLLNFEQLAENNNKTYQFLTSMQEIKLQGCENRRRLEWVNIQENLYKISMRMLSLQQKQEAGSILINESKNIVTTVIAAAAVIHGEMTLGMMLAIQYIIGQLNSPVSLLVQFIYSLQDVQISLERINEIKNMEEEDINSDAYVEYGADCHDIVVKNVHFKYDPHSPIEILKGVSLTIPHNRMTAIVGASGSGKTTLLKLLLGYYPTNKGDIILAGCNLQDYKMKWWRSRCGVVMQDGIIFSESIARNIAVDDGEIDTTRLKKSAQIACIDEFVQTLPLKYETKVGKDGMGLSKGQQQRVLIARAVYKNPDFIILDEATNSLDANNEQTIVDNLSEYYKGRTVIIIAHRLSTVRYADKIVVMESGKIVEIGTHESLIKQKGYYHKLVRNQLDIAE